ELGTDAARDPFNVFREFGARTKSAPAEPPRAIRNAERKALHQLGLDVGADKTEIKARFKLLVKRHHPDANGGDRAMEDKLREIIQAYNYLKSAGALKKRGHGRRRPAARSGLQRRDRARRTSSAARCSFRSSRASRRAAPARTRR